MKSRNQKRPKHSDKKSRKSKKMKGGLKVERQLLGICEAVAISRCLYRLCKLVFHSDTDETELYIPNENDKKMYEEYKSANETDKSDDKYKRVRTIEENQKKLFFSFLAVLAHGGKNYKLEEFVSPPFQKNTRNPFYLNDNDEFSVIENKNDFHHVYIFPFDEKLRNPKWQKTGATFSPLVYTKQFDADNQKLKDWLNKNAGLEPEKPEVQRNNYNDIITKLEDRGYKLKESDYSPTSKNYRPDKMNHFYQNKNRMQKYVDKNSKQIQTDKIETISTYLIYFEAENASVPKHKGRVGGHVSTFNSVQEIDKNEIKIRYVDPNFFDEQENTFNQGVINFRPYYLSPIDKKSLPRDWDDIKLKWAKYMLPNFGIEYNDDTNNERIQSNIGTIDENFFDIAIPSELHQDSEQLNVSMPVDVYSLIGKTFKYIEFNSTHDIVSKVREYKIVEDGENGVKFVLSS